MSERSALPGGGAGSSGKRVATTRVETLPAETAEARAHERIDARSLLVVGVMTLLWGCNWPMLKLGVNELPPLTFRTLTLPFSAVGLLTVAHLIGERLAIPRRLWSRIAVLAFFNITGWNGFVLFGLREMSAGRSAILAYTMPVWAVLLSTWLTDEPLDRRRLVGLLLGMAAMAVLLGEDVRAVGRSPYGTVMILVAAASWGMGTVLLRRWRTELPPNAQAGWLMLLGWVPLALLAPWFDPAPLAGLAKLTVLGWTSVLYNVLLAGIVAHLAWFRLARTLPVAVSSLSSLPVPVVGVISGMLALGERPGPAEYAALVLVALALAALYWPVRATKSSRQLRN